MKILSFSQTPSVSGLNQKPPGQEPPATPPQDSFQPDQPKPEKYPAWTPLANAAVVGGLVGVPSILGAVEHSLFGPAVASGLTWVATPIVAGLAVGAYAFKSSKKEFNGHPILTGLTTLVAGGAAAVVSPFLKTPGAVWGWQGALIATGVAAAATGVISAVGIHHANQNR